MEYNVSTCTAAIQFNGRLSNIVSTELRLVKDQHHETLKYAAGWLYLNGFLDMTCLVACGASTRRERRKFIVERRDLAVAQLREAGIIPAMPPIFSLAWFVFKWVILPFIQNLLDRYSDPDETSAPSL